MATLLVTLFIIVCALLIVVVLLQKGRGGGLGAALGGMGSSAFGTRTGDVFTWVTVVMTGLFLVLAIGTSFVLRPKPGLVSRPVLVPPSGSSSETTAVTMQCGTVGAAIYFTMDGSEPTENSTVYRKAVRVPPGTTLKARAFRAEWEASEVAVGFYGPPPPASETQPAAGAGREPGSPPAPAPSAPAPPAPPGPGKAPAGAD